jgi:hypothetical protein
MRTSATGRKLSGRFSQAISHQKAPIGCTLAFTFSNRIASEEKSVLFNFAHFSVIFSSHLNLFRGFRLRISMRDRQQSPMRYGTPSSTYRDRN